MGSYAVANMKIISLLDALAKEARADLEAAIVIVDDEIEPLQTKVEQLNHRVTVLEGAP